MEKMMKDTDILESHIREKRKVVDYDVKSFTVALLTQLYTEGLEENNNKIYIPNYQSTLVWDKEKQSKFVESVILDLPIPFIFTADVPTQRLEIVDGSQRVRTLAAFMANQLCLESLDILNNLTGCYFEDLPVLRQRKFQDSHIRLVIFDNADENARLMMFKHINNLKWQQNFGVQTFKFRFGLNKSKKNEKFYPRISQ